MKSLIAIADAEMRECLAWQNAIRIAVRWATRRKDLKAFAFFVRWWWSVEERVEALR